MKHDIFALARAFTYCHALGISFRLPALTVQEFDELLQLLEPV